MPDKAECMPHCVHAALRALALITLLQGSLIDKMWEGKLRISEIQQTLRLHTVTKLR